MNIFEAINNVMKQIGAVGKDSRNEQQKFMYRGIDAVMNALNPALIANKVFVVPTVLETTREERETVNKEGVVKNLIYSVCKIKFTFYAEDGSFVEAVTVGEGMDYGDKATNKAMSIAFKYACFQVFCIPTEEMVDPDAECFEVKKKTITPEERAKILHEINRTKVKPETICAMYKVKDLADLPGTSFDNVMKALKAYPDYEGK